MLDKGMGKGAEYRGWVGVPNALRRLDCYFVIIVGLVIVPGSESSRVPVCLPAGIFLGKGLHSASFFECLNPFAY